MTKRIETPSMVAILEGSTNIERRRGGGEEEKSSELYPRCGSSWEGEELTSRRPLKRRECATCAYAPRVYVLLSLSRSLFSLFFLKTYARLHTQPVTLSCCNARALHCRRKDDDDDGDNDDDDDDDLRQESVPTEGKINPYAEERPRSSTVSRLHQSSHYCC